MRKLRFAFKQFKFLFEDLKRWKCKTKKDIFYLIFEFGIWATLLYRISRFFFLLDYPILKIFFRLIAFFLFKIDELLGVALSPGCQIGPGLYIGHVGVIRIHPDALVGEKLSIGQLVVIGTRGVGYEGVPLIGDNVYIGVGAKILGEIRIGNNVVIGANAVVISDIPDNSTVVGVPGRIVKNNNLEV